MAKCDQLTCLPFKEFINQWTLLNNSMLKNMEAKCGDEQEVIITRVSHRWPSFHTAAAVTSLWEGIPLISSPPPAPDTFNNCLISVHKFSVTNVLVTREIKLFCNNYEITSVFYFTRIHVWNRNKIISAAEGVLKLFQNYFSVNEHVGKYSRAAISLWNNFEIISGKFPHAEIILFQTNVDEGWNKFEIILFHKLPRH